MSPAIDPAELDLLLAREYFSRTRFSSLSGILAVSLMAYLHIQAAPGRAAAWWAAMVAILGLRGGLGQFAVTRWLDARGVAPALRAEMLLSLLLGIGWGGSLFVFDSGTLEPRFYLRLVIVAAVVAFVLSSSTAFLCMPLICAVSVGPIVLAYLMRHPYIEPHDELIAGTLVEAMVVLTLAYGINRRVRAAASNHLAVIKLSRLLEKSARTDELTQVLNRRGILEALSSELAKSARHALPLSVLMADIDHFKAINDSLGHAAGDEALRAMVRVLTEALREGDSLGRLGGEEFLVLLPMLDGDGAMAAAERLRKAVAAIDSDHEGRRIPLTVSIGIGCRRQGDTPETLLGRADAALYAAKHQGRNRVEMESTN